MMLNYLKFNFICLQNIDWNLLITNVFDKVSIPIPGNKKVVVIADTYISDLVDLLENVSKRYDFIKKNLNDRKILPRGGIVSDTKV